MRPKLLYFASGTPTGGGSGFEACVEGVRTWILDAEIVGVVSNHERGGVWERAKRHGIPFHHFPAPWTAERYREIVEKSGTEFVSLSGWVKLVQGLDPRTTFNIHPGPLPRFGGKGLYGHHVHEAVLAAYRRGEIMHSAVSMHFVTEEYDRGPCFFSYQVKIRDDDTPETLGKRVNEKEHVCQAKITNLVVHREIAWDGTNPESLRYPRNYFDQQ